MSLINQMLQDLEKRRPEGNEDAVFEEIRIVATPERSSKLPFIFGFGLLALATAYLVQHPHILQGTHLKLANPVMTDAQAKSADTLTAKPIALQALDAVASSNISQAGEGITFEPKLTTALTEDSVKRLNKTPTFSAKNSAVDRAIVNEPVLSTQVLSSVRAQAEPAKLESTKPESNVENQSLDNAPMQLALKTNSARVGKKLSPEQKLANDYRQALDYLQMGRVAEAQTLLSAVLEAKPEHQDARQTLASLLLDHQRKQDAMVVIKEGLDLNPAWTEFRVALARLQYEANQRKEALATMEAGVNYAHNNAEYHGFFAVLLQRDERHQEAIEHYTQALAANGTMATWLIGLGVSLQTLARYAEAKEAFERAQAANLTPELAQFVGQRLKVVKQQLL